MSNYGFDESGNRVNLDALMGGVEGYLITPSTTMQR